jgi:hypothetical protein
VERKKKKEGEKNVFFLFFPLPPNLLLIPLSLSSFVPPTHT